MADTRTILVTGVSEYWGWHVASRLVDRLRTGQPGLGSDSVFRVIGLDIDPPLEEIKGLDFIQADIRNPLMAELLSFEEVYAICDLAFLEHPRPTENSYDFNVMGTTKLFGACAEAGVKKIVYKSGTMIYGASSENPGFLTEESPLRGNKTYGVTRDLVEIETFLSGFRRQVPEMIQTILRFPSIIGPTANTPMTRYLKQPWNPVLMGFDPQVQIIHEDDVIEAILYSVFQDIPGVYNVAADGVLPLSKLLALVGKMRIPIFHPFAYWRNRWRKSGLGADDIFPYPPDYLRYSWVADLTQMHEQMGFLPHYTAEEALREFSSAQKLEKYMPEAVAMKYDEDRLRDTLERRKRARLRKDALNFPAIDIPQEENLDE